MSFDLRDHIRSIKGFPKPGINFRDITTILKDPAAMNYTLEGLMEYSIGKNITKVVGVESRGFIFGSLLANRLKAGFVLARKPGKLPAETESASYELEYGTDKIEIHKDAISSNDNVLLHDDLLATGGTAEAACKVIEKLGGKIILVSFIIELTFLNGRNKLNGYDIHSIVKYDSEE
jgi:adenine phosphoribosyltransferase